ncbi:MAG: type II toxin-antitoxin system prevent-host-death family antitoxin [Rhizobiales bacterium]|nr:type II toxin-antitoxin system prevent-host-death family antitoxin [Hyphomicrobiales bacterium]
MRVSSGDFIRKFGTYTDSALSEPIIITKNGRERLVLLSMDEYNTLLHLRDLHEDSQEAVSRRSQPAADAARRESTRKLGTAGTRRKAQRR